MFIEHVNDSPEEIDALVKFMKRFTGYELRILRFNPYDTSIKESEKVLEWLDYLKNEGIKVTLAQSHGKEINAACGQMT